MKRKNLFLISSVLMVILLLCMVINWLITPFSDTIVRVLGGLMIVNLCVLVYSTVKLKSDSK